MRMKFVEYLVHDSQKRIMVVRNTRIIITHNGNMSSYIKVAE